MSRNTTEWHEQVKIIVQLYHKRLKRMSELAPQEKREVEAVRKALEWLQNQPDGAARVKVIELYHIKQSHSMEAAAAAGGYSRQHGWNISHVFLHKVAEILGYVQQ